MTLYGASVALLRGDELLVIQRHRAPSAALWTLPGGRLEPGESPEECAVREIAEELGLTIRALCPVSTLVVDAARGLRLAVFATRTFEGDVRPDAIEIRAWHWLRPAMLRELPTTPGLVDIVDSAFRLCV